MSEPRQHSSVPPDCSLRVLDSSSGVQKDTIYGILGGGLGFNCVGSNSLIAFWRCSKIHPEIDAVFIDFGSQNKPQIHPEITKKRFPNQSRNQSQKKNKNILFPSPPNPENRAGVQAWCYFPQNRCFRKVTKNIKKSCKHSSQNH